MTIKRVIPIRIEWDELNGFMFNLIYINRTEPYIDSSLLGIYISQDYFYIELLWLFKFKTKK